MANRIINRICVKGEEADLKNFLKAIEGEDEPVDFNRIFSWSPPVKPEEMADVWGTGSEYEVQLCSSNLVFGFVVIKFETRWCPPHRNLLMRLKARFPDITF